MSEHTTTEAARRRHPVLAFFAGRPVTVIVLFVAFSVLGLISLDRMPLELIPGGVESKFLSVNVPYSKGQNRVSPETVEREVTLPVEAELSTIPGVKNIGATSSATSARFWMEFESDRDMDEAYAEVMAALERARIRLPDDVGTITVNRRRFDGTMPIAFVNFYWEPDTKEPHLTLEREIQTEIENIEGVSNVDFFGTFTKFIAVDLDADKAVSYGVNLGDLLGQLRGDNFRSPAGKIEVPDGTDSGREVYLVSDSKFESLSDLENFPVRDGLVLSEITRHGDGHKGVYETYGISNYVRVNGRFGATAMIFKTGEANTVGVGDRMHAKLEELESKPFMSGFSILVPWSQSESIKDGIRTLIETLAWGGLLAVLVLTLFLKSWRLSLVIASAIPITMLMALGVMYFMGETINLIILMGFTLAAGMLLDNAIVVAENVYRRFAMGEQPMAAAVRGAGEIALALVLATSTTVVVFVCIVFFSDDENTAFYMGKLGLPVMLSLAFSIVLALVVIPMTMLRAGVLRRQNTNRVRIWFVSRRLKLKDYMSQGGTNVVLGMPMLLAWEFAALFIGRNSVGLPSMPIVNAVSRGYIWFIRLISPARFWLISLVLLLSYLGIMGSFSELSQTDRNQGRRERISFRVSFPGSSDLMVQKQALQIIEIPPDSAAAKSRLAVGDFILRYNEKPLPDAESFKERMRETSGNTDVRVICVRGSRTFEETVDGGDLGITVLLNETDSVRDSIWATYVFDVEKQLLGEDGAETRREKAMENGFSEEEAFRMHGRTPDEAKARFGIRSFSSSFSSSRARFWIYLEKDRVDEGNQLYQNIVEALPERAGVEASGQFEGGSSSSSEVEIRIEGPDTRKLIDLGEQIATRLEGIEGLEGVRVDMDEGLDEVQLNVERQRASAFGVAPDMMTRVLSFQLSGTTLRDYQHADVLLPLRVRFAPPTDAQGALRDPTLQDISESRIPTGTGGAVSARSISSSSGLAKPGVGSIRRNNRQTSMRVVGTTSSEDLDRISQQVDMALADVKFPAGYSKRKGGRFDGFGGMGAETFSSVLWAALFVFLVMCFLFESFLKPICILIASIPGAFLGGFGLLYLTDTPFDLLVSIGAIVLIGIVVNNGIVMVDLINRLRKDGVSRMDAVLNGCQQRLRPVLLTTFTTVAGLVPMAIGESNFVGMPYAPMGRVVLGGMLLSMVYTLMFVPLIYLILDDVGLALKNYWQVLRNSKTVEE
ncbi:MAG: efflux RND transporter permease subunit [Planctomycetota bacterium]